MPLFQQKHASEFLPLCAAFQEKQGDMVRLLDQAYAAYKFTKTEKDKLAAIISSLAADLLAGEATDELKDIYRRHSGSDFDDEEKVEKQAIKSFIEEMFDVELDEGIDLDSPEKMAARINETLQQRADQEEAREESPRARKKTARQAEKERKAREEAQSVSQSIREVYRKLVSMLHPDREQDAAERERKTLLMQRVNLAYDNKDLLRLLELQLEVECLDQATIDTFSPDRLRHFNKVLTEQAAELQQEIGGIEMSFCMRFDLAPGQALTPGVVLEILQMDIESVRDDLDTIKSDLEAFQDARNIKQWLRTIRRRRGYASQRDGNPDFA